MKKILIISVIFAFILSTNSALYSKTKDFQLKIPVRVFDINVLMENLSKDDFTVSVNKKNMRILSFESIKRTISNPTSPFRNFILSFNLYDYGEQVSEGIEYFIRNILTDIDKIMIITPKSVYTFSSGASKDKTINDIKKIVKKDCQIFKGERAAYENSLKEMLSTTRLAAVPATTQDTTSMDQAMRFVNSYQREWLIFKDRFLIPDVNEYKAVAEYFYGNEGDKWFINFQQREIIPELDKLRKKIDNIRDFIYSVGNPSDQSWAPMIEKSTRELEKSLLISDEFPQYEIQDILLSSNISYNVILFKSKRKLEESDIHEKISPDYEEILRNISRATGGFTLATTDLKDGLLQLSQHSYASYLISIPVNTEKDLKIDIELISGNYDIHYKKTYSNKEIKKIVKSSSGKVKISDVSVKNKSVKFTLSNFSINKSEENRPQGILEVKIVIKNEKGDVIYKTSNTLTTFENKITITLPFPSNISGKNRVFIFTEDKISNLSFIFNRDFVF